MTENHCMIDIETLGRSEGSVVISMGAAMFDRDGVREETFYAEIDPSDCQEQGLEIDGDTLQWWLSENPEEACDVIAGGQQLEDALTDFNRYFGRNNVDKVWAKSPIFDIKILEAAFNACDVRVKWNFWETRDVRTLISELSVAVTSEHSGQKHNALDDAVAQAENVAATLDEVES
jgi:hypothetical protein